MSPAPRLFLCFVVAGGLLGNLSLACRGWAARAGLDLAALPELEGQLAAEQQRQVKMDIEFRAWNDCSQRRYEIAGEVIRGRMALREAAARFRDLNARRPDDGRALAAADGDVYEERCCRQVIVWVAAALKAESPARAARVTDQLEAELQEHLRETGTTRLVRGLRGQESRLPPTTSEGAGP